MAFGERRIRARRDERRPPDVRQRRLVAHLELDRRRQRNRQSRDRRHKRFKDDAHGSQCKYRFLFLTILLLKLTRRKFIKIHTLTLFCVMLDAI